MFEKFAYPPSDEVTNSKIMEYMLSKPNFYIGAAYDEEFDIFITAHNDGTVEIR